MLRLKRPNILTKSLSVVITFATDETVGWGYILRSIYVVPLHVSGVWCPIPEKAGLVWHGHH